jgi:hypothetical protein
MAMNLVAMLLRGRLAAAACISFVGATAAPCAFAADAPAAKGKQVEPAPVCAGEAGRHGTQVDWLASPGEAAKRAKADGKLLLVMQISGNFAREEFT